MYITCLFGTFYFAEFKGHVLQKITFFMYHVYWPIKGINMYLYFTRVCCMVVLFPHMHSWLLFGVFSATFQSFLMLPMSTLSWSNIFEIRVLKIFLKIQKLYFQKIHVSKQSVWAIYAAQTGANDILNSFGNKHSIAATGIVKNIRKE